MIAPTCATAYAMVDAAAPAGTTTEAFAWLATAIAIGTSAGAAAAGRRRRSLRPRPDLRPWPPAAGLVATLVTLARAHTLSDGAPLARPLALAAA